MGFAMLKGWLAEPSGVDAHVVEPVDALRERAELAGAAVYGDQAELADGFTPDMVILAVKPQVMRDVLPSYGKWSGGKTTYLSVAAGVRIETFASAYPGPTPIIRCMPNTPAAIGKGMMVCCLNAHVTDQAKSLCTDLLSSSGRVNFVDDESQMDAVTAVSGSGPAYIFHFIECLTKAGEEAGLPAELAAELAMQTVYGAGVLAARSDTEPSVLRQQVTSPGGTTAAALDVFMGSGRLQAVVSEAVAAAADRSRELA